MESDRKSTPPLDLPIPLATLVGREREAATILSELRQPEVRLLTVTGPGGVGKTRLALHVAAGVGHAFPDGVVFVGLATITDSDLVAPAVATILGVREAGDQPLVDTLRAFLRDKNLLLVLDNFEQVVEAAPVVATLLAGCPGLTVLATSRVRLRVSGEREFPLPPLGLPEEGDRLSVDAFGQCDAIRLFVDRTRAVRPDFVLSPDNALVVADIFRRLDGLPLAIELAAARITVLPPSALLARLARRLPLLSDGGRDLPARQQTMRDTIAWSYGLLEETEQALFRRLAVFVGGFSLEAGEAVGDPHGTGDAFGAITTLVENNLLRREDGNGEPRFRMLETIREFGEECLAAHGEEALARQAHAAWFLTLAEAVEASIWSGPSLKHWLDRLEADHPNVRAALSWFEQMGDAEAVARVASALAGYWHMRSHRAEGCVWLDRAFARGITSDRTRARALLALGNLLHLTGSQRVTELFTESLALSRELGDQQGAANALFMLGTYARDLGEHASATSFLTEAVPLAEAVGNLHTAALARLQLGVAALGQSGAERAEPMLEEALALFRAQDDAYGVACAQLVLGWAASDRRDISTAAARYAESLDHWQELGTKEGLVDVLAGVAALVGASRQPERAIRVLAAAEALGEAVGYVLPVPERARYDRTRAELRSLLGEAAFAQEWAAGQVMPPEDAVAGARAELADILAEMPAKAPPDPSADGGLTPRERQVLRLVVAGRSNPEIAGELFLSRRTVTTHLTRIFAKLGVHGRSEAAVHAVRHGLL